MAFRINIPPVTRGILALIIALSVLYNIARLQSREHWRLRDVPYLALVPSQCLRYPWTILTATFVEQNLVTFMVNTATIFFGGKYLERAWGSKDFAWVILITSVIPNLLMIPIYLFMTAVTGNSMLANTPITGGVTTQAAFLVAFKQLVPEHTVSIYKGMIKMRVKHFPAVFLAVNTLSGFILMTDTALILAWLGLVTAWIYLRFYKRQPDLSGTSTSGQGLKGDPSDTFAFATFFPNVIQPPIAAVCNQIFLVMCTLNLCTPFSEEAIATGNEHATARGEAGLPNFINQARGARGMSKREEAERRRALALKALDQRLNAASSNRGESSTAPVTVAPTLQQEHEALGQTDYQPDR